jgi:hypothetical protein
MVSVRGVWIGLEQRSPRLLLSGPIALSLEGERTLGQGLLPEFTSITLEVATELGLGVSRVAAIQQQPAHDCVGRSGLASLRITPDELAILRQSQPVISTTPRRIGAGKPLCGGGLFRPARPRGQGAIQSRPRLRRAHGRTGLGHDG